MLTLRSLPCLPEALGTAFTRHGRHAQLAARCAGDILQGQADLNQGMLTTRDFALPQV